LSQSYEQFATLQHNPANNPNKELVVSAHDIVLKKLSKKRLAEISGR